MDRVTLGQIVQELYGREAGEYAVVIDLESPRYVWVADGNKRPVDKPKKKNIKHIQPTHTVGENVLEALKNKGVTNADLRSDLNRYLLNKKRMQKGE